MEAIRDSFLVQHVVKPHFRGNQTANVLDLVFTNEREMINTIKHEAPVGKSHHQTLLFKLRCNMEKSYTTATATILPRVTMTGLEIVYSLRLL